MERQPKLTAALITSLASPDAGVETNASDVRDQIAMMAGSTLDDLDPEARAAILSIVGHVWYSTLTAWANGRRPFSHIYNELERAVRLLLEPYD
jgi:hypothetical protein